MAKRTTNLWSWRWPGKLRAAILSLGFVAAWGPEQLARADDVVRSNATVLLDYRETDYNINNWGVNFRNQTAPFKREPAAVSGKVFRGVLDFSGVSTNSIPFLWQRDARKLFLDLNRNRDLTDDSNGVYMARTEGSVSYQTFTNVHLLFNFAAVRCQVLADLNLYDYGNSQFGGIVEARSFWQGKATLNGRDWQVGITPNNLNQSGSFENSQLLLRPWEERNRPFAASDGTLATVQFPRKLFLDGHAFQLDLETRSQDGEARPALRFAEQSVALGEVKITGQFIQRLVLSDGPFLMVLDQPSGVVKIPLGSHNLSGILLKQGGTEAFFNSSRPLSTSKISVTDKAPAVLDAGGPLTNSVVATREGQDLRLDYKLIGAGGATYQLANRDSSRPPAFAIYKGNRKIASDNFQFG